MNSCLINKSVRVVKQAELGKAVDNFQILGVVI